MVAVFSSRPFSRSFVFLRRKADGAYTRLENLIGACHNAARREQYFSAFRDNVFRRAQRTDSLERLILNMPASSNVFLCSTHYMRSINIRRIDISICKGVIVAKRIKGELNGAYNTLCSPLSLKLFAISIPNEGTS